MDSFEDFMTSEVNYGFACTQLHPIAINTNIY